MSDTEGWRDIASAPKGDDLILVSGRGHVSVAYWDNGERLFNDDIEAFWRVFIPGLGWSKATILTHWQPLPAPPTEKVA